MQTPATMSLSIETSSLIENLKHGRIYHRIQSTKLPCDFSNRSEINQTMQIRSRLQPGHFHTVRHGSIGEKFWLPSIVTVDYESMATKVCKCCISRSWFPNRAMFALLHHDPNSHNPQATSVALVFDKSKSKTLLLPGERFQLLILTYTFGVTA
jgi:hypothetical protein